jgi:hypothetical protein
MKLLQSKFYHLRHCHHCQRIVPKDCWFITFENVSYRTCEYKILFCYILGYRSGGPGSIPGTTRKKKVVGLEWGPLSLMSTTEELLDRKVEAPV